VRLPQQRPGHVQVSDTSATPPRSVTALTPGHSGEGVRPAYGCNLGDCYVGCDALHYGDSQAIQRCYRGCERACG
jgi:hypothetical protein